MRTIRIEYLKKGSIGDLFTVIFIDEGIRVGHWPIHGGLALAGLVEDWILRGRRPQ